MLRRNTVSIGSLPGWRFNGIALTGTTTATVEANTLFGGFSGAAHLFNANYVYGANCGALAPSPCPEVKWNGGGTVSNNCIVGEETRYGANGTTVLYFSAFVEASTMADPSVFQNNDLYTGNGFIGDNGMPGYNSALYVDEGTTKLTSAAAVNALGDMSVSGTVESVCSSVPPLP